MVAAPVQAQDIVEGEPVPASAPAEFDVDVDVGQVFGFTAEPAHPGSVHHSGQWPRRIRRGISASSPSPGSPPRPSSTHIPGSYRIIIVSTDNERDDRDAPRPRACRSTRTPSRPAPAVFDVDVDTGQLFGFTAEPADPDGVLTIQVNDPDEFATAGPMSIRPHPGSPPRPSSTAAFPVRIGSSSPPPTLRARSPPRCSRSSRSRSTRTNPSPPRRRWCSVSTWARRPVHLHRPARRPDSVLTIRVNGPDGPPGCTAAARTRAARHGRHRRHFRRLPVHRHLLGSHRADRQVAVRRSSTDRPRQRPGPGQRRTGRFRHRPRRR